MIEIISGYLIKLLDFMPGIRNWVVNRFGRLEVTPINGQGINIFHKRLSENAFFVKLHFHARANTEMEILNVDFTYGPGFTPLARYVWDDDQELHVDSYFRLVNTIALSPGKMHHLALQTDFVAGASMKDYDEVVVEFEINSPAVSGVIIKKARFKLAPGGVLEPPATQKL